MGPFSMGIPFQEKPMKKLFATLGQDLSAYATIELPADTDLSEDTLSRIAQEAVEKGDIVFDAEWSSLCALRIVCVTDDEGICVMEDLPVGWFAMSKHITNGELAEIVTGLLVGRLVVAQLDSTEKYAEFMTDLAALICDHCGGEVTSRADNSEDQWMVGIRGNDSLPEAGGVWKDYDREGDLFDSEAARY